MRFTPVEVAAGVSLMGTVAAVAIPVFVRDVHASSFAEPVSGLARIGNAAVEHAEAHGAFPATAPLTPPTPPRGKKDVDPPGAWDTPAWAALRFRASPEGVPHAFSFAFDSAPAAFVGRAHGDLDGDGIFSTFEIRGAARPGSAPAVEPGMYVEAELE